MSQILKVYLTERVSWYLMNSIATVDWFVILLFLLWGKYPVYSTYVHFNKSLIKSETSFHFASLWGVPFSCIYICVCVVCIWKGGVEVSDICYFNMKGLHWTMEIAFRCTFTLFSSPLVSYLLYNTRQVVDCYKNS